MLKAVPPIFRKREPRVKPKRSASPTPAAPVLVAATYVAGESVTLTFDRAISLEDVRVDLLIVDDGVDTATRYSGADAYAEGENAVRVTLSADGDGEGDAVRLTAPATVAIRAVDGGLAWAGVVGLVLPFG